MTVKNQELTKFYDQVERQVKKIDSTKLVNEKQKVITAETTKFDAGFHD